MKKSLYLFCIFVLLTAVSCIKDEQAYTTFTGDMVYSFLQKDTNYSEFVRVLDKAGLKGMLSSYTKFTCFAPTNSAMQEYYRSQGRGFNLDSLRPSELDTLAKSHILPVVYHTYEFTNGVLPSYNLNYDYLEVHFDDRQGGIVLNGSSRIISKDHDVYNGVVHGINRVIELMVGCLPDFMAQNPDISIFYAALRLTHLSDSLTALVDIRPNAPKAYYFNLQEYVACKLDECPLYSPRRRFGYTAFVENNALLNANGIQNVQDLIVRARQLYPSDSRYDADYSSRENSLNKYISYHLINKAIYNNRFFYTRNAIKGYTPDEFLETMLTNRIIRVSNIDARIVLNSGSDYAAPVEEAYDKRAPNGMFYLLDHMLVYSDKVEQVLQNTRIRFDVSSLFPELTNNNMRGNTTPNPNYYLDYPQFVFDDGYLTNVSASAATRLMYFSGTEDRPANFPFFQTDVLYAGGYYDFTIRLLPVPPGTYELRVGSRSSAYNLTQLYVDNLPMGLPVVFSSALDGTKMGYLLDSQTDDDGVKNDQLLRMKGCMKAPNTFWSGNSVASNNNIVWTSARDNRLVFRKIVGVFSFTDYKPHSIRFRSLLDHERTLAIDYFELVPKSIFNPGGDMYESRD